MGTKLARSVSRTQADNARDVELEQADEEEHDPRDRVCVWRGQRALTCGHGHSASQNILDELSDEAQRADALGIDRVGGLRWISGLEDPVAAGISGCEQRVKRTMCHRRRLDSNICAVSASSERGARAPQPDENASRDVLGVASG